MKENKKYEIIQLVVYEEQSKKLLEMLRNNEVEKISTNILLGDDMKKEEKKELVELLMKLTKPKIIIFYTKWENLPENINEDWEEYEDKKEVEKRLKEVEWEKVGTIGVSSTERKIAICEHH